MKLEKIWDRGTRRLQMGDACAIIKFKETIEYGGQDEADAWNRFSIK
jgi:hypothetical protein